MEGVTSEVAWTTNLKGFGYAEGKDCTVNVTAIIIQLPKGLGAGSDQGALMTMGGDNGYY